MRSRSGARIRLFWGLSIASPAQSTLRVRTSSLLPHQRTQFSRSLGPLTLRTGQEFVMININPKDQAAAKDVWDVGHDRRFKSPVEEQAMHSQRLVDLGYLE